MAEEARDMADLMRTLRSDLDGVQAALRRQASRRAALEAAMVRAGLVTLAELDDAAGRQRGEQQHG